MTQPLRIVCLLFPQVTQLDLTGPAQVFTHLPGAQLHLVWHRIEPVGTDAGFAIVPTTTLSEVPQADVLFVPGGQGAFELFGDDLVLEFLSRQADPARYVASVCTGAFLLGAAGLLRGRRATTHWASLELLALLGAQPTRQRVVRDGNVITGAGVSSGIDLALTLAAELCGPEVARGIQLGIEYDPQPPFDAGAPGRPHADPSQVARMTAAMDELRRPLVARAASRLARPGR